MKKGESEELIKRFCNNCINGLNNARAHQQKNLAANMSRISADTKEFIENERDLLQE